ncbi:hypothetical protein Dsin_027189 [Dipteronia sinensis]|uniref:Uncharacterized protein n=1 Tax=Dipteronia sinensis TaxID=43782 RepID=A0AAE0A024_9ROSI|nr:hypothetical protein Dsin_027189 [Dipteronia sinensis]
MGKSSLKTESSKSDRKFEKKVQFYAKVRDTVTSLAATKAITKKTKLRSRQKKLKTYDLSSLSEFLPELKGSPQPAPAPEFKLNCKSRKKLIILHLFKTWNDWCIFFRLKEGKQLSTVLNHPAFQADALAAIHQHLKSTQPILDEKAKKRMNKNGGKKKKKGKNQRLHRDLNLWICELVYRFSFICLS